MIGVLLASALLLGDAEDCAVLEAVLPEPVEANLVRIDRPEDNSVEWTGVGRAVFVVRETPVYADWPELGDDRLIPAERYDEVMHWHDVIYPGLPENERQALAAEKFGEIHDYLVRELGELPEGLASNFIETAAAQTSWNCPPDGWGYQSMDSTVTDVLAELPNGTGLSAHGLSRPGYSSDGQWALVYYSQRQQPPRLDEPGIPEPWASGGVGYVLLRQTNNGWVEHDAAHLEQYN
jgi:hypothetical protein